MKRLLARTLLISTFLMPSQGQPAPTLQEGAFIRDAECEHILKEMTVPLFKAAGLNPKDLQLHLLVSRDINASATVGSTIIINTGLLLKSKNPEQVIGVLAHETGHIAGGHLANLQGAQRKSMIAAIGSVLLGAAAAAAGSPDAAAGIMQGGMITATKLFYHFTRGQEGSADQAALKLLDRLKWPARGLYEFMKILQQQEFRALEQQDPYLLSHPLSEERVRAIETHLKKSGDDRREIPQSLRTSYERLIAKLEAFIETPGQIFLKYSKNDTSFKARYARAIAHYRKTDIEKALGLLSDLLKEHPNDPYLWELKGQIEFETGQLEKAARSYKTALDLAPHEPLIRLSYTQTILETKDPSAPSIAEAEIEKILEDEKDNPFVWRLLAVATGKQGKQGESALALAEEAMALGKFKRAAEQAKRALHFLTSKTHRLRAKDLKEEAEREERKKDFWRS